MYKLVWSEEEIKRMADFLKTSENTYMMNMSIRKKYDPSVQVKTTWVHRKVLNHVSAHQFVRMVKSYQVEKGLYVDDNENSIDEKALVLYMSINPRDPMSACQKLFHDLSDAFTDKSAPIITNTHGQILKHLQSSCTNKRFHTLDIDDKSLEGDVKILIQNLHLPVATVIETRGGFHILLDSEKLSKEQRTGIYQWKINLENANMVEYLKDAFCPIPGTIQGGFCVHFRDDFVFKTEKSD